MRYELYHSDEWAETRTSVYERDNYTCFLCGADGNNGTYLQCHHVVPLSICEETPLELDEDNLCTLCRRCHCWLHEQTYDNHEDEVREYYFNPFRPDDVAPRFSRFALAYFFTRYYFPGVWGEGAPGRPHDTSETAYEGD